MLTTLVISVFSSFGISVALVEKGSEFPVSIFYNKLKGMLEYISKPFSKVMDCTVCLSFWMTLFTYPLVYFFPQYSIWLLSGFITLGFSWIVYEILSIFDVLNVKNDENKNDKDIVSQLQNLLSAEAKEENN